MRLRLAAVAAAILVGLLTIPLAFDQEVTTRREWRKIKRRLNNGKHIEWIIIHPNGHPLPEAVGNFVLGDCSAGRCTLRHDTFKGRIRYTFDRSSAAGGDRMRAYDGHRYFRDGWQELAASDAQVDFAANWADAQTVCRTRNTNAQCRNIISSINDCWDVSASEGAGHICRNGLLYGPNLGGVAADGVTLVTCSPVNSSVPIACRR